MERMTLAARRDEHAHAACRFLKAIRVRDEYDSRDLDAHKRYAASSGYREACDLAVEHARYAAHYAIKANRRLLAE
jgi:hypothetical protein